MKNFKEKVIIALDYNNLDAVRSILERLKGEAYFYKIGPVLFTSCGIQSVELIKDYGCKIFLDLKFHDIPNTVYNAVKSAGELGVGIINVHASGGVDMMKSAKKGGIEAAKKMGKNIDVIAVTILTSLAQEDLRDIFYYQRHGVNSENPKSGNAGNVGSLVLHLAELAKISGLDGVVCSGYESLEIKKVLGDNFKTIVPGIRLAGRGYAAEVQRDAGAAIAPERENIKGCTRIDDQKRVMTPSMAFNSKADYIVAGREITASNDPLTALKAIYNDIERFAERT
ncbi:MAG: orotidine-5'-phosphate decarboxylase [Deltaproteobacteria bacterium]|nr:orotidine-5'-phosphate decarboxylase [Deltaproteobacteria bacterium]